MAEGTLESILSTGTPSLGPSMCPQDLPDSERKVKLVVRARILKLFPKDDDSEVPKLTQTVKCMKVPVTRIVQAKENFPKEMSGLKTKNL